LTVSSFLLANAADAAQRLDTQLLAQRTIADMGAVQGLEVRDNRLYVYADRGTGVIREFTVRTGVVPVWTGREIDLGALASHPTGLTTMSGFGSFLGSTVNQQGVIFKVDWSALWRTGNFARSITNMVVDDLAVNGSRPEFVRVGGRWLIATADYGDTGNEIRLYDPDALTTARKTSAPGVLVARFPAPTWVQNLHWLADRNLLVLVQNQVEGAGWRLSIVDLAASLRERAAHVVQTVDFAPMTELEGFHVINSSLALAVDSSGFNNLTVLSWRWQN
jgi:hypothetical protein